MRAIAAALIALALSNPQSALSNPQSAVGNPQFLVHLDVSAVDARGRLVADLTPADFDVREGGRAQGVDSVRFVRDEPRLIGVFLDEYHVGAASTRRVREAMTQFVRGLRPADQLVVMKPLDSLLSIQLSTDRDNARETIDRFEGRRETLEPRNAYERNFIAGSPERVEAARAQVAFSAINALAVHLGSLGDARKTLIVVTEDLPRLDRRRGQEAMPALDTILRSAARANVSVYPFDPTGAPHGASGGQQPDPLRRLADETSGKAIAADAGLLQAVDDASGYYLLTFHASAPDDGRFHETQVGVKRKGVRVQAARGYWAPSPDDTMRAAVLARMNEPKKEVPLEPAPHASPLIRPWFGMSRGPGNTTRVTVVWEPAPHVPGDRVRRTATKLVLTALAPDGSTLYEGPVAATGPATIDEPGTTPARAVFDAPPGRLRLRMSIQDAAAQEMDRDVRELPIRDLRGVVAIGTPEILRARNAREFRTLDGDAAVPVAAREFSRTEHLLIRFPAYGSADAPPSLSATLLGRGGNKIRILPLVHEPAGDNAIDLPLANLAAGEYIIELTATTGGTEVKDRLGFRVTS